MPATRPPQLDDPPTAPLPGIIGSSQAMAEVYRTTRQVARSSASVLLLGETGTGKELIAHAVHALSDRRDRPFVRVNCGALSESLLESELFGHVRGAFTGAVATKKGRFALADGGTLFLDEVGTIALTAQAKLLRVLQEREFEPLGSERTVKVDVRVIAATNRDLPKHTSEGQFLEDLYYRLNVLHVTIPPLRDRREDVPALLDRFLRTRDGKSGEARAQVSSDAVQQLMQYSWPGNVRQLEALVERLVATCAHRRIEVGLLPREIVDKRQAVAHEDLFTRVLNGQESFWSGVYAPFMAHDLSRRTLRELVRLGLEHTSGDYRQLAGLFRVPERDYTRFLRFLRDDQRHVPLACTRSTRAALRSRRRNGV